MVEDAEKKVHSIMENLYPPTKSPTSFVSSYSQSSRQKRQADRFSGVTVIETRLDGRHSQVCRPWDRPDLWRRLATFKSITWFAKPKAANAVSCARRGWINVDVDTIACEVCEARLLFSTPSSWSHEQLEKAALVFSLKLNSGHKRHCSWTDNACEEALSLFPSIPPPDLIEDYKRRSSSLLRLTAVPVITPSAIEYMNIHHNERLLTDFLRPGHDIEQVAKSAVLHIHTEDGEADTHLYHQAIKLISLCGWELRSLPYVVDPSLSTSKENTGICVYSSHTYPDTVTNKGSPAGTHDLDPNSVILECKICGASVGLWSYSSVPRPLEFLRLVGYTEIKSNNDLGNATNSSQEDASSGFLRLTIAGGPPPAKHNFKAQISMPVIGQNLIARLSSSNCTERSGSEESAQGSKMRRIELQKCMDSVENGEGMLLAQESKFNPIIQHKHFCPWITGTDNVLAGWRQTLSASPSHVPSCSTMKDDDPVGSIRKLFTPGKMHNPA